MYLHLGQDVVVPSRSIIGIFDIENTSVSRITKDFLGSEEKLHHVVNVSMGLPKSFVICRENKGNGEETVVYISQISCATLKKRAAAFGQGR